MLNARIIPIVWWNHREVKHKVTWRMDNITISYIYYYIYYNHSIFLNKQYLPIFTNIYLYIYIDSDNNNNNNNNIIVLY